MNEKDLFPGNLSLHALLKEQFSALPQDAGLQRELFPFLKVVNDTYAEHDRHVSQLKEKLRLLTRELEDRRNMPDEKQTGDYRKLFLDCPIPAWIIEKAGDRFTDVNTAALNQYGYTKQEFLSLSPQVILASGPEAEALNEMSAARTKLVCHKRKDGSVLAAEAEITETDFLHADSLLVFARDVSDSVRTEAALRAKAEQCELLSKATNDAIWLWDLSDNVIHWSEGYTRLFGYQTASAPIGGWIRHIHPDDRSRVEKGLMMAIQRKEGYWEDEYRYFRSDSSIAQVYDRGYIVYSKDGRALRVIGAMQDISGRKEAENSLKRSEANLRSIIENTDMAYLLIDEKAVILSHNQQAMRLAQMLFGIGIKEGDVYTDLLPEPRRQDMNEKIAQLIATGRQIRYEVAYKAVDGSEVILQVSLHPIHLDESNITALSVAAVNITERVQAQRKFERTEAKQRTIFDNTETSYILTDTELKVISFNRKAAKEYSTRTGTKLREGQSLWSCLTEGTIEKYREKYLEALRGRKLRFEKADVLSDGTKKWWSVSILPVKDKSARVLGLIIVTDNITGRKTVEMEKEKMTQQLIQRNKDLEQFAYIISHNLRSPVANITGLTNLLLKPENVNGKDFERCLTGLAQSVQKLDEVIMDLNFILQTRKEIHEKKEPVRFEQILADVKTSIQTLIEQEKAGIVADFSAVTEIQTIKSYLTSIFFNLVMNSIRHRHAERKPLIRISTQRKDDLVVLIFKDNGMGIDLELHKAKLFGLYKKFHENTDGKGMGLYMVKTQVEMLGGRISIESEVGKGTRFVIELPLGVS